MENDFGKKPLSEKNNITTGSPGEAVNSVMRSDLTKQNENEEPDLPGYPHYPSSEDLLNPANNEGKIDIDIENLSQSDKIADLDLNKAVVPEMNSEVEQPALPDFKDDESDIGIVPGTEADLTEDDLVILGSGDQDMDLGEDEEIKSRSGWPLEVTGEDLDVPGAEDDDENESIGGEDEENNYYSLGGDQHSNLEDPA